MKHFPFTFILILVLGLVLSPVMNSIATVVSIPVSMDTTLFANDPDSNLGADDLAVGTTRLGYASRALLRFDLVGTIPSGAAIQSVRLSLEVNRQATSPQSDSYELHRFLVNWTEGNGTSNGSPALPGQTSWNSRAHGTTAWAAPGSQAGTEYIALRSGISAVISSPGPLVIGSTPAMVSDVQQWLAAPSSNFGWIVMASNEGVLGTARRFTSRETGTAFARLEINYVPEPTIIGLISLGMLLPLNRRRRLLWLL